MRAVAAIPAIGLLAGAACGLLLAEPHVALSFGALSACTAAAIVAWAFGRTRPFAAAVATAFLAGGVPLGADAWQRAWRPPLRAVFEQLARAQRAEAAAQGRRLPEDDEAFAAVEGVLRRDAESGGSGVSLSVDVDRVDENVSAKDVGVRDHRSAGAPAGGPTHGGIVVTVVGSLAGDRLNEWRAGRRVRLPVTLRRAARYLDPGVPDHERALARRGTTLVGTVKSGALVELLARGSALDESLAALRAFARRALGEAVGRWSRRSGAIVAAIVIGDRAGLDQDVQRRLQEAGTYHVIAISGGNIAILAGVLLGAFRFAGWLGRAAMLAAIVLLTLYAMLVGGGASVDRATLMALVYFGGRAFDQRSPPLNSLAVVASLLVATDPLSVADPAFLLTFGATLAILAVVPAFTSRPWPRAVGPIVAMFAASAAAEAMLFPIGALVFSRVTFAGLGLNFVAIPLMGVAQIAGMAVVATAVVSRSAAMIVGWIAHLGAAGLVRSSALVRYAPGLAYRIAPPSGTAVALYYSAATAAWVLWRIRNRAGSATPDWMRFGRRVGATLSIGAALWILVDPRTLVTARGDGRLHVTFIDVGQGDAAFVRFPRGSTLVVDAGGLPAGSGFDIGDRVVAPVVRDAGFRRIDYLALTHGDPDHIGGATAILSEFGPREVWEGIPVPRDEPLTRLRMAAQARGARWANVYAGDRLSIDDVDVVVRHPAAADWERQKVRNDDSVVIELRWRDVSVLLTGDIGRGVERAIGSTIPPSRLRVVKVPHHGSLSSSTPEFLQALRPQVAVVSAGRANHFGHPAPEVLDRYRAVGAAIFRTDRDGAVTVDTDGTSMTVHTYLGRHLDLPRKHETGSGG